MMSYVKQFNDSGRVRAIYGVMMGLGFLSLPIFFGLFVLSHANSNGWSILGGVFFLIIGVTAFFRILPDAVREVRSPQKQSESPMNLWLPVLLTILALLSLYAEHGKHGDLVKEYAQAAPAKFISFASPGLFEALANGVAIDTKNAEKAK